MVGIGLLDNPTGTCNRTIGLFPGTYIEKVYIKRTRVVNFITVSWVVGTRCVHYIEQKKCTAVLDAGGI